MMHKRPVIPWLPRLVVQCRGPSEGTVLLGSYGAQEPARYQGLNQVDKHLNLRLPSSGICVVLVIMLLTFS